MGRAGLGKAGMELLGDTFGDKEIMVREQKLLVPQGTNFLLCLGEDVLGHKSP